MIESYFQLSAMPFSRDIPVEHLWHSEPRNELHSRLVHIAKHKSFGVFTGDAGSGKTTAIRRFAAELDKNHYQILYISDSSLTPRNFYWEALHQLGQVPRFYRGDAQRQLHKTLRELREQERKNPVVVVDEAHLLSRDMLEEVRFLLNEGMDSLSNLSLILIGQSELNDTLKLRVHAAIVQRIDMRFHLSLMECEETTAYIHQHLKAVQASRDIFTDAAVDLIHDYCEGCPRRVNKLAIASMMTAASRKSALIDDHMVHVVIEREFEF